MPDSTTTPDLISANLTPAEWEHVQQLRSADEPTAPAPEIEEVAETVTVPALYYRMLEDVALRTSDMASLLQRDSNILDYLASISRSQ